VQRLTPVILPKILVNMRFVVMLLLFVVIELYAFKGLRMMTAGIDPMWKRIFTWVFWISTFICYGLMLTVMMKWSQRHDPNVVRTYNLFNFTVGFFIVTVSTKLIFGSFHLVNDLFNLGKWAIAEIFIKPTSESHERMTRSQFFNQAGLGVAALWAGSLLYGITRGKYAFRVIEQKLEFADLPEAFDGLRVVHISDMHLGSFREDFDEVQKGFDLINSLDADYVFFTGDMVNNYADEAEPWIDRLKGISARFGKFSVLGNHDYGDYAMGDLPEMKLRSQQRLAEIHAESGFRLLKNENVKVEKDGQSMRILGCENWGLGFHQYGDLDKTLEGSQDDEFKILLSHDPTHWSEHVYGKHNIALTLSGHTHGAQMGIELPQFGIKFSPVSLRYKRWGGLYNEANQYLHINRGFGFLAFPGRVGMAPEITLIELKRK
jgi:hypothetical protein